MKALSRALPYVSLLKLRIVALLVVVAVVAALVAGDGSLYPGRLALLALAGGMACAGASVLNNYIDRDIDAVMARTRNRAIPGKKVAAGKVLALGVSLIMVALAVGLRLGLLVSVSLAAGAAIYVLIYTLWLKRRTVLNIVIGGLSGSCVVLAGWFAVHSELSPTPFLIALMVFLWTPAHFWSFAVVHRDSYHAAGVPMLPLVVGARKTGGYIVLHSMLLLVSAVSLYFFSPLGAIYLAGALLLGSLFLFSSIRFWQRPGKERAWLNYKLSGLYLLGLFLLLAIDTLV